jgi:DNA polymerase
MPEELSACQGYLDEQIELLQPKVIVTLGRISMAKFIENGRISSIHGQSHEVKGQKVVTMYHPAAALHQPALRQTLMEDFSRLKRFISISDPSSRDETQSDLTKISEEKTIPGNSDEDKPPEQLSLF